MDLSTDMVIKNADLNGSITKNLILRYLRQRVGVDKRIKSVTTITELDHIRDGNYIMCPRFSGTRSWIIFFNDGLNYYAVNFPKQNINKQENLRIFPIDMDVAKEIYRG